MASSVEEARRLGQSIWYDNIRRGLITSGELSQLIALGVTGVTSNPTIFEKAIAGSTDYDSELQTLARTEQSWKETYESLALEDIRAAADLLSPAYLATDGADGYACLEVSPALAHDTERTLAEARRLFDALDRPNVMIKVPATEEGIPAIRRLIGQGINVNVTLIFSLERYRQVMEAYTAGLEDLSRSGGDVGRVASVASFFVSRIDTLVDALLEERLRRGHAQERALLGRAAVASAKLAYRLFQATFAGPRFAALRAKGARVQRPLWASTSTKNPAYSDLLYVAPLIGPDTVNTMPQVTLAAFLDHGRGEATLDRGVAEAEQLMEALAAAGIGMEQVTAKLLDEGVKSFADSFDKLLANIEGKRERLLFEERIHLGKTLGALLPRVDEAVIDLRQRDVVGRMWRKDHTVWKTDPTEITDRLGWLTVTDPMGEQVPELKEFAREVQEEGFHHVVLLGMGGSSLGPEALRQTFGRRAGYPELVVLDSTVPDWVRTVTAGIDPATTLFLVSSKSGGTLETSSLYLHFRSLAEAAVGAERAGRQFVAITDPGTPLASLAAKEGFRRVFLNPSDIGGRYSVLSYFGLVPAALAGIDIGMLLDRADCMREGCPSCVPPHDNPGAWLGAAMGKLAQLGRNKLTLVTSPELASFGLWVEQLIAESTGKEGRGIIPVAGEPLLSASDYADDRLFVYLRIDDGNNVATDTAIERLNASGQPLIRLDLKDRYDLGAEFFRWEFATAVAGSLLGIHPFDQPNVQQAKDLTGSLLGEYQATGLLPKVHSGASIHDLLSQAKAADYLAIMAYVRQTPEMDRAFEDLRQRVRERRRIATTLGYGPRFLHSTGQLHKGGPANGLFLQLTADHSSDIPIPGAPYTFGVLAEAQAIGDLRALQALGRRVASIRLGPDMVADVRRLAQDIA